MYDQYKSHDDAILSHMEDGLCRFLTFKDGCLLQWTGKKVKPKSNALWTTLVKKQMVDEQTNAETWTLC